MEKPLMQKITFAILFICLAILPGCQTMQAMLNDMDKPTASIQGVRFADLSLNKADMLFDVKINNPYAVALPLSNLDYGLSTGGNAVISGKAKLTDSIPAKGSRTITLPVNLIFADLLKAAVNVKAGQVLPYEADLRLAVDAPGVGELALPMSKKGEVPVPAVPDIALQSVTYDSLSWTGASATLKIDVTNTNAFDIDLSKMGYDLKLAGQPIVSSVVNNAGSFKPGQSRTLEIPISFSPAKLGTSALGMLKGSGASFELSGDMELGTKYGNLSLPYNQSGKTVFKR